MRSRRHRHSMRKVTPLNGSGTGWVGPYQISSYFGNAVRDADARPPEPPGLYIVSERPWRGMPDGNGGLLYIRPAACIPDRNGHTLYQMGWVPHKTREDDGCGHRAWHTIYARS